MKRRIPLLITVVALALVAWWLSSRDTGTTLTGPLTDFAIADTARVDRIFIAEKSGATVDLQRDGDRWTVNGSFTAKPHMVQLLLQTFLRAEVRSTVPKSMQDKVLRVMSSTAKKVEIYQGGGKPVKIWYVGHATQDHFGTFMLLEKPGVGRSEVPFEVGMSGFTGFLTTRFHAELDEWRDPAMFAYPDLGAIAEVQVQHPTQAAGSFVVRQSDSGELAVIDGQGRPVEFDTLAVQDMLLQFKELNFEAIERKMPAVQRDSILHSTPLHVLTVVERDGKETSIPFFKRAPEPGETDLDGNLITQDVDRMYALMEDTLMVLVQRYTFDRVTPPLDAVKR